MDPETLQISLIRMPLWNFRWNEITLQRARCIRYGLLQECLFKIMNDFTHIDQEGNPTMVDISAKTMSLRKAIARSIISLPEEVAKNLNGNDIITKKGSVFQTAIVAGIMAAKKTGELIPLCHPLGLDNCNLAISLNEQQEVLIDCTASITAKTGVEMEALVGASIAALTIYDMCKAMSHDIVIKETKLIEKTGGKRDFKRA